jgi:HD superfamily phosphohydrolase
LEKVLLPGISHEALSGIIIGALNSMFNNALSRAIDIFEDRYPRRFFHQLVASQLDIDRLDYLNRDSFFTGVREGNIGSDRIIKLLHVVNDELVVEEKGLYSIENFLSARRLMYWQVYLHKTVVGVENMLIQIIRRAKELNSDTLTANKALNHFMTNSVTLADLENDPHVLSDFCSLDDYDLLGAMKIWRGYPDRVLSELCNMLAERRLFRVMLSSKRFPGEEVRSLEEKVKSLWQLTDKELGYYFIKGVKSNAAYIGGGQKINVLMKSGEVKDIALASDLPNIKAMRKIVKKYYLCWPKILTL